VKKMETSSQLVLALHILQGRICFTLSTSDLVAINLVGDCLPMILTLLILVGCLCISSEGVVSNYQLVPDARHAMPG
jgi:hypothetical protein